MVSARVIAIDLPVHRVRNPRQRMPVSLLEGGKRPLNAMRVQSLLHVQIFLDVAGIVVGEKVVVTHAAKGKCSNRRKDQANSGNFPRLVIRSSRGSRIP